MLLDKKIIIEDILKQWSLSDPIIEKEFNKESSRIILKISDGPNQMLLKGIPDTVFEEAIIGNVTAHKFLKEKGNLAPDILATSTGLDYIHSDIGPHNSMRRNTGELVFIDLDDAGVGSRYLDLGWPFIMQFVDLNHSTKEMHYRFDLAKAFLSGYYENDRISENEYDLLWYGAIFMHISYMQCYGPYAVDSLWNILKFGIEQKDILWNYIHL